MRKWQEWLRSGPLPLAAANALGFDAATTTVTSAMAQEPFVDLGTGGIEHWQRIALIPGLELMLRANARQPARLAAQRIIDEYVVTPMRIT